MMLFCAEAADTAEARSWHKKRLRKLNHAYCMRNKPNCAARCPSRIALISIDTDTPCVHAFANALIRMTDLLKNTNG